MKKWEDTVKARPGFSKTKKSFMLLSGEARYGIHMTAMSFVQLVEYLFSQPVVTNNKLAFLSQNICQDPLENYFGCQRQRGGTSDNPSVHEYYQNTEALRDIDSFCRNTVRGNCRGVNKAPSHDPSSHLALTRR